MAKFKVGDKVRVKRNLKRGGIIVSKMPEFGGSEGIVTKEEGNDYMVSGLGFYWWPDYALQLVADGESDV